MFVARAPLSRARLFGLILITVLFIAAPFSVPQPASAQAPSGCVNPGNGQPCSGGTSTCVNPLNGQACGSPTSCSNGVTVFGGGTCPPSSGGTNCVNPLNGQPCGTPTICPNGVSVFGGGACPPSFTCPDGAVVGNAGNCAPPICGPNGGIVPVSAAEGPASGPGPACCPSGAGVPTSGLCTSTGTGTTVTYQAGWNLIALPPGTTLTGTPGPLYTEQAGDSAYEVIPSSAALQQAWGYWAYFPATATLTLAPTQTAAAVTTLPAAQWQMIGNPGSSTVAVTGANASLFTYSPGTGYQQATSLAPGQGGWVLSPSGGSVTISGSGVNLVPPGAVPVSPPSGQ